MGRMIRAKDLGFIKDAVLQKKAVELSNQLLEKKRLTKNEILQELHWVIASPETYEGIYFQELAKLMREPTLSSKAESNLIIEPPKLQEKALPYSIFGAEDIDPAAIEQMENAMRLPIAITGALMPDAHVGYGLPIGGVLATDKNTVIPYAVGVDIACRMCLSVFDRPAEFLDKEHARLEKIIFENTYFGINATNPNPLPDDIFDRPEWNATPIIRELKPKAMKQLGTSGTGNHFVEWGILKVHQEVPELGLEKGKYLALLSHSGSRGFGASIANYYSKLAMQKVKLPGAAKHLAWLELDSAEGQEYWLAMNLAGHYASANHHQIHRKITKALGIPVLKRYENHHNFAWKEKLPDGRTVIIHRKGATPAKEGEIGIIPGSLTQPGFLVRGRGNPKGLNSAAHGAGRKMSRRQAFLQLDNHYLRNFLAENKVKLIGGDLDEAPMVYKDIGHVMHLQSELVDILATFQPRIARMADPDRRPWARED
ncbi:MAG: RtcB family protein [Bacteroidia bacterium]|nr:RtcB family protein [Bacteroidia bacterium]MDW8159274.1 RtcB family protein [Bacteroidia bacterium]